MTKRFGWMWLSLLLWQMASAQEDKKPNMIVIMADDMGYGDVGFTGCTDIKTPHLDALAASGVIFQNGYVNHPFCGPSRAAFLSGRYPQRFGFETNPAYDPSNQYLGIDVSEKLFPRRLQQAGYTTGLVGKWHLGAAAPFHPNKRGFDYFYGFLGGGHNYFEIDLRKPVREAYFQALERNGQPAGFEGYLTTALSIDAADFVRRNREKPFFLFVAYNAPHAPLQAPAETIEKYSHIPEKKRRIYAAMVDEMDSGIGKIVEALDENNLRENTLVVFLSDNGGPQASRSNPGKWNGSSNTPFRGGKGDVYDGGIHVPMIASWPKKITKGSRFDHPVMALDIARTAVRVGGGNAKSGKAMEGVNLLPYLVGQKKEPPHQAIYWKDNGEYAILDHAQRKLLKSIGRTKTELFHLSKDRGEEHDKSRDQPDLAKSLQDQWNQWDRENIPSNILLYTEYHKRKDAFYKSAVPEKK